MTEFGGPDVLRVLDLPDPEAAPGEVRIRVHAAAVNPTDTVLRSGGRAKRLKDVAPPHVPGMDVAGELEQIGDGAMTDLRIGDRVMAIVLPLGTTGGCAERVVVPAESVAAAPAGMSVAQAATLPMNGLTARLALDELALEQGQTLAVTGAAGAVGGYVVQLGKAEGLRIVADAAASDEQLVRELGADVVVRRGADFSDQVRSIVPDGVDGLVDAALLDELAVGAVRDSGRIATVRGYDGAGAVAARHRLRADIRPHLRDAGETCSTGCASSPRTGRSPCGWPGPSLSSRRRRRTGSSRGAGRGAGSCSSCELAVRSREIDGRELLDLAPSSG